LQFIKTAYKVFHLPTPELVLSTRPENYIGDLEEWDRAEAALKQSLDASGQLWTLNEGDGAFYGPKIDIMIEDSDRKKHQTATIQLDFQLPRRFGLEYLAPAPMSEQRGIISEDPVELSESGYVTPVIIHRAVMGSLERFMALLIEHYDGKWPFWLSPRQAIVIPVAITDEIAEYAQAVQETISGVIRRDTTADGSERDHPQPMGRRTFHVDIDMSTNSLPKKIRAAKTNKYNHVIVVGERNMKAKTVNVDTVAAPKYIISANGPATQMPKSIEMTPIEVYNHFVGLEDQYA
jgi:threonyl-tRNA synthetase